MSRGRQAFFICSNNDDDIGVCKDDDNGGDYDRVDDNGDNNGDDTCDDNDIWNQKSSSYTPPCFSYFKSEEVNFREKESDGRYNILYDLKTIKTRTNSIFGLCLEKLIRYSFL